MKGNVQATGAILRAEGLAVGYRQGRGGKASERRVLADLDLELRSGELVCLLGPNGAGKSTLLRTLAGLQKPLAGRLIVEGEDFESLDGEAWARKAAIVLTERMEAGSLDVYDLVALGRHPHTDWTGRLRAEDRAAVERGLEEAGAWDLRDRLFDELSDGEKQRVMLARALAQDSALLLLDEPTAFLDLPRRVETMRLLRKLARDRGRAILLSTHDLDLALRAADRLWLLNRKGRILSGLPEDLALNGAFASAFDQGDVAFDAKTGQFRIHAHPDRSARIEGDPVLSLWTERALQREGYGPEAPASPDPAHHASGHSALRLRVECSYRDGRPHWHCAWEADASAAQVETARVKSIPGTFSSLESLCAALRDFI